MKLVKALILLGIVVGLRSGAGMTNFSDFWSLHGGLQEVGKGLTAATGFGLFVGICVAQTNSLFSFAPLLIVAIVLYFYR